MTRQALVVGLATAMLAGCASDTWIYTWERNPTHARWEGMAAMPSSAAVLQQDWTGCIRETNKSYIPAIAGTGPRLTLIKDCMEARGYTKVQDGVNVPIGKTMNYDRDTQTVVKIR